MLIVIWAQAVPFRLLVRRLTEGSVITDPRSGELGSTEMTDLSHRIQSLAFCYENSLTSIVRLAGMPVEQLPASASFRANIRGALQLAMQQAKASGYPNDVIHSSLSAVVAFLDESVLSLQSQSFADWAQRPLAVELFGHARMGEVFFENLGGLLARQDSEETADCLDVYCLCLLLGFRGRYALSSGDAGYPTNRPGVEGGRARNANIDILISQAREKIDRIRGRVLFLGPEAPPPEVRQTAAFDRWSRGLGIAALCLLVVTLFAYGYFWITLNSGLSKLI